VLGGFAGPYRISRSEIQRPGPNGQLITFPRYSWAGCRACPRRIGHRLVGLSVTSWVFAGSNVGIIAALPWWRAPRRGAGSLPTERLVNAVRTGARHAANTHLRATLVRVVALFPFAIAYLSLLPLVARAQMADGPQFYGILLGAIGGGTVGGTLALTRVTIGADSLVAIGAIPAVAAPARRLTPSSPSWRSTRPPGPASRNRTAQTTKHSPTRRGGWTPRSRRSR
jgi:hypothetical protein